MGAVEPHVQIGLIVGTHGIKGGLKVRPLTDFPERFERGRSVYVDGKEQHVLTSSWHKGQVRLQLEGVETIDAAEALRGRYLTLPAELRPELEPDEYLERDLIGMAVVTQEGRLVGRLDEIVHAPAHDLFRVGTHLIPAVKEFVKDIDTQHRTIRVHVIPGLLDESEAEVVAPSPHNRQEGE